MGVHMSAFGKKQKNVSQGEASGQHSEHREALVFDYVFAFENGEEHRFRVDLDPETLLYLPQKHLEGDNWTRLEHNQCENCSLDPKNHSDCPVALNIRDLIKAFADKFSYETADITVHTNERSYFKKTTMQKGVASLMGILMVSNECPVMSNLRPMVRFHLPFASILETTFRTTSTYLLGQFFHKDPDKTADFSFLGLLETYRNVNRVNQAVSKRIRSIAGEDATENALIILDILALDVVLSIEDQIEELKPFFIP